jgi:hypothetical protein
MRILMNLMRWLYSHVTSVSENVCFRSLKKTAFFLLRPILCFQFLCQRFSLFTQSNNDPWQLQWSWGWTKPKAWIIAITVDNCETNVSLWFLIYECCFCVFGSVHLKCLYARGLPKLHCFPQGSWFCGHSCEKVSYLVIHTLSKV